MSKPIRSFPESERRKVIERRVKEKSGGLGYVSAVEAQKYYKGK